MNFTKIEYNHHLAFKSNITGEIYYAEPTDTPGRYICIPVATGKPYDRCIQTLRMEGVDTSNLEKIFGGTNPGYTRSIEYGLTINDCFPGR